MTWLLAHSFTPPPKINKHMNNILKTQYCTFWVPRLDEFKVTISWCTESRCGNMIKNSCPSQPYLRVFQVRAALFHHIAWGRAVRKPDRGAALNEKLILSEHVCRASLACSRRLGPRFSSTARHLTWPPHPFPIFLCPWLLASLSYASQVECESRLLVQWAAGGSPLMYLQAMALRTSSPPPPATTSWAQPFLQLPGHCSTFDSFPRWFFQAKATSPSCSQDSTCTFCSSELYVKI